MESRFGHFPYAEASEAALSGAGEYRDTGRIVRLLPSAAAAFRHLSDDAKKHGMTLVPISGFRTRAYQESLFLKAVAKHGSEAAAARWVAPAGYSEHHTGLALDIGSESRPEADVESIFEKTPEANWLLAHAPEFGFELSFPRTNSQAVAYEPWHWRFVGTNGASEVFAAARTQRKVGDA